MAMLKIGYDKARVGWETGAIFLPVQNVRIKGVIGGVPCVFDVGETGAPFVGEARVARVDRLGLRVERGGRVAPSRVQVARRRQRTDPVILHKKS